MAATGFAVAVALAWSFWNRPNPAILRIGFIGIFASYAALFLISRLWFRLRLKTIRIEPFQLAFATSAAIIGIFWSVVLTAGLQDADLAQTSVLYALAVGLMSAPAFSGPALYALSLWIPVTIGALVAVIVNETTSVIPTLVGLFSYALLTLSSIIYVNARTIEREVRRIDAEQQREVIGLLLRDFQEGSSDFLWETTAELDLVNPSSRFVDAARTTPARLASMSLIRFLTDHRAETSDGPSADAIARLIEQIGRGEPFHETRVVLRFGDAERCWSLTGKPILDTGGRFAGYRGVGSDVTAYRQVELQIAFIARHDSLTGLANRMSFNTALQAICANPMPGGAALLCLDLDHFKSVNDRFGHQTGDAMLVAATGRICQCLRAQDQTFRLGGDEFAILLPHTTRRDAEAIADRIVRRLAEPFAVEDVTLTIGACAGIAMILEPGHLPETIHHAADLALYHAKSEGRGTLRVFNQDSERETTVTRQINAALVNDFDSQTFFLEYQPIVSLESGRLTAVEALIRWDHAIYGILPPSRFIPAAEHNGSIVRIGAQVIDMACAFATRLPASVSISINLSPIQLHDPALPTRIATALARNHLGRGRIEFELTETAILDLNPQTLAVLGEISALGCRIGLDDFGSGYSSIATLYYFDFDRLKIDRSLIRDAMDDPRRRTILRNMTRLAREIGLEVTGEGVETEQYIKALAELGFDAAQGSVFSAPLLDAALLDWIATHAESTAVPPS